MLTTPKQIRRALDRVLHKVTQPARYTDGELNSVVKDWDSPTIRARVALAFPDIYELGGSNLGLAILYDLINNRDDLLAERVYCPWIDFEAKMRENAIPLYGLESAHPIADFDIFAFSLPYEQLYTNVLTMLDLAAIPLRATDRSAEHPVVIAGGSDCFNPEPMSAFFDAMVIGEGEEVVFEVIDAVEEWKKDIGYWVVRVIVPTKYPIPNTRHALWTKLAAIPGVYVPSLYEPVYAADGTLLETRPLHPAARPEVMKRVVTVLPPPALVQLGV